MATAVVVPAESATAEPQHNFEPSTFTDAEHAAWMEKGTIPKSKTAESTPATDPQAGAPQGDKSAAESANASPQDHKGKKNAESRIQELLAERNADRKRIEELIAKIEGRTDVKAEPSTAKPDKSKLERPQKPSIKEGESWEQFEARQDAYLEDLADFKAKSALQAENERRANEQRQQEAETANKAIEASWKERRTKAEAKFADWADVALGQFPVSAAMDGFILDSEVGPEVLYKLGQNDGAEAKRIAALPPYQAVRELVKIEASLSEAPADTKPKGPVTPITRAAKPATELRATNAAPSDPMKAAVEADDFAAFSELRDRQTIERRKRG